MKQIKIIFSFIFIILGICIITISKIAEQVVPKNGFYNVDLTLNYGIGGLSIIAGSIYLFISSKALENYSKEIKERNNEFEESNNFDK